MATAVLTKAEYARFMGMVNTNFERFRDEKISLVWIDDIYVLFVVRGFCDYRIVEVGDENGIRGK